MNIENEGKRPLTTGQIAQYCHVTHRGVLKWVESGKLKAYRTPGMHSRVSIEDFLSFLKEYNMPVPAVLQPAMTHKKILIVDDDRSIVHSLQRVLMLENKYIIEAAYDGFQAGLKLSEFKPDFVILDICMPGVDGYQVCAHIRKELDNKKIKILAVSGMNEAQDIKKIMDLGADDYLEKPFSNEELQKKINRILWGQKA
ncbi:MAG: response regulator [Candidatus Omnitrophica bacterium]|nr:response regulator [Candidatus Omnitrophota bacterium]